MDFKEFRCEGVDQINVAQTRDQQLVAVNIVMNLLRCITMFHKLQGIFDQVMVWQAEDSLCCMELDNVVRQLYCIIILLLLKEMYGQLSIGTLFVHKQLSLLQLNS